METFWERLSGKLAPDTRISRVYTSGTDASAGRGNQCRVRLQAAHTDSMTGTSTRTPTTVASAAPESAPNSVIATATASSKKLLAPISAPGAATLWGTLKPAHQAVGQRRS